MEYRLFSLIDRYRVVAKKSFGQNFLSNKAIIEKIIGSFDFSKYDLVLEIGPGLGALTTSLIKKSDNVVAVESDIEMYEILKDIFKNEKNIQLFQSDFRRFDVSQLKYENLLIISNLPYNLTSDLIAYSSIQHPKTMGFMVQKEVAEKYTYKPNKVTNDALGAFLNMIGNVTIVTDVAKTDFFPVPKVDSAFIKVDNIHDVHPGYLNILKKLFKDPNKTLNNNIKNGFDSSVLEKVKESHFDLMTFRARQCSIDQLRELCSFIEDNTDK